VVVREQGSNAKPDERVGLEERGYGEEVGAE